MTKKFRVLLAAAFVAAFGVAFGGTALAQIGDLPGLDAAEDAVGGEGGLEAPAVGTLGDTEHGPCVEELLNLPALDACVDEEGRVIMDLPALKLVGPADQPDELPVTGFDAGTLAAMGGAALAAGTALVRRVRLALAS
jgi:hypothetical protein